MSVELVSDPTNELIVEVAKHEPVSRVFPGEKLEWRGLTVVTNERSWLPKITLSNGIKFETTSRVILDHVSGSVSRGELLAIMGPSGSGKTTLLNTLAGRDSRGEVSGTVLINGERRTKHWRHLHGYVEQDEIMHQHLTVLETLTYSALLRLPRILPPVLKQQRIEKIMADLGLQSCAHTKVGLISGGERKRLSIAIELLHSPTFLFLDEPTSGLDSFMALAMVEMISRLARAEGKAIILTIHQPRSTIMDMFTNILLLTQGKVVFFGPVPRALDMFEMQGLVCPAHTNPTDFLLDSIIVDPRSADSRKRSQLRVDGLVNAWKERAADEFQSDIIDLTEPNSDSKLKQAAIRVKKVVTFQCSEHWNERPRLHTQFGLLLSRYVTDYRRFRSALMALAVQTITLAIVISVVFWDLPVAQTAITSRLGLIFFLSSQNFFGFVCPLSHVLPTERKMIKRERTAASYKASAVYMAKVVSVLPQAIFSTLVLGTIVYFATGLQFAWLNFVIFMLMLFSLVVSAQALGLIIGALVPNAQVALIIAPMISLMLVVFAGNIINTSQIPDAFSWVPYISAAGWAYKALVQNEFRGLVFDCPSVPTAPCFRTGEMVLEFFGVTGPPIYQCFIYIWALTFAFHLIGYAALRWHTRPKVQA